MKVTYVEFPEGLTTKGSGWHKISKKIVNEQSDVLVTNEMPFGTWLAASSHYDLHAAQNSISAHNDGMKALKELNVPLILSSKPIPFGDRLANEAFALECGHYQPVHHKHYFPDEPGFYETAWFKTKTTGFEVYKSKTITIGVLLCTEVMFTEWARSYRRQGAQLIVIPRASEQNVENWKIAASMVAIVSGCYVVSSNRVGKGSGKLIFGGNGFAFAPDGSLISQTSPDNPIVSFELDLERVAQQQQCYPCYVKEIDDLFVQ
ncbi:carbon-nitrogen hydrolase family protein [Vibrio tritonius]|uniref:carbon-nitrogen hydrolase family protein n=1 Tax=Vibrio tritonius TaxID=1435069 RepID=UPI00315C5196